MKSLKFIILGCFILFTHFSFASVPAGGGAFPGLQIPEYDGEIKGIRLNTGWGYHKTVYGIDMGLIGNTTSNDFVGMAVAGVFITNLGRTVVTGLQFAGLLNRNSGKTHIGGMQMTLGINSAGKGVTNVYGMQVAGLGNIGKINVYGLQFGLYNEAETVYGFQIGLINKAKSLHGIQIGLANFADDALLSFFPVINIGF